MLHFVHHFALAGRVEGELLHFMQHFWPQSP